LRRAILDREVLAFRVPLLAQSPEQLRSEQTGRGECALALEPADAGDLRRLRPHTERRSEGEGNHCQSGEPGEPHGSPCSLGSLERLSVSDPTRPLASGARRRSPSKQVLPKRGSVPQNRCYQVPHRKGAPVTEPARREYAAVMRTRYQAA